MEPKKKTTLKNLIIICFVFVVALVAGRTIWHQLFKNEKNIKEANNKSSYSPSHQVFGGILHFSPAHDKESFDPKLQALRLAKEKHIQEIQEMRQQINKIRKKPEDKNNKIDFSSTSKETEVPEWKTYSNDLLAYSYKYPNNWRNDLGSSTVSSPDSFCDHGTLKGQFFRVNVYRSSETMEIIMAQLKSAHSSENINFEEFSLDGAKGFRVFFDKNLSLWREYKEIRIYLYRGNDIFCTITLSTDSDFIILNKILDYFRFL